MGLLDDAIREHLELKRRRGADPGEIAHQERAALEPVFPPEETEAGAAHAEDAATDSHHATAPAPEIAADAHPVPAPQIPAEGFHGGQETAEIDMQAVLDGDDVDAVANHDGARAVAAAGPESEPAGVLEDEALEWEMPGEEGYAPAPEIPGQERMSFE
jgi:hypothetical protein